MLGGQKKEWKCSKLSGVLGFFNYFTFNNNHCS